MTIRSFKLRETQKKKTNEQNIRKRGCIEEAHDFETKPIAAIDQSNQVRVKGYRMDRFFVVVVLFTSQQLLWCGLQLSPAVTDWVKSCLILSRMR